MSSATALEIPGYLAGTWDIDPAHTDVGFVVRHMVVTKVRGRFDEVKGHIVTAENPLESSVDIAIDLQLGQHEQQAARRPPALRRTSSRSRRTRR